MKGAEIDPYSAITSSLSKTGKYTLNTFQINFVPVASQSWKKDAKKIIPILTANYPRFFKIILLHPSFKYFKMGMFPFILVMKFIKLLLPQSEESTPKIVDGDSEEATEQNVEINTKFLDKLSSE